jgi:hypothetical protein
MGRDISARVARIRSGARFDHRYSGGRCEAQYRHQQQSRMVGGFDRMQ